MINQDVKYLKYKTYLSFYCPHCNNGFNIEKNDEKSILFYGKFKKEDIEIKLSPFLDVFDIETSIPMKDGDMLDDLICPHCKKSLLNHAISCEECNSQVGEATLSAYSKLIPFYICLKYGCEWHGVSKSDAKRVKLKIPRQSMPEQDRELRVSNFQEV